MMVIVGGVDQYPSGGPSSLISVEDSNFVVDKVQALDFRKTGRECFAKSGI